MRAMPPPPPEPDSRLQNLAHDLINAVAFVKGQAQLLERRLRRDGATDLDMLVDRLGRIDQSADRMADLVNGLRRDARPRAERGERHDSGVRGGL